MASSEIIEHDSDYDSMFGDSDSDNDNDSNNNNVNEDQGTKVLKNEIEFQNNSNTSSPITIAPAVSQNFIKKRQLDSNSHAKNLVSKLNQTTKIPRKNANAKNNGNDYMATSIPKRRKLSPSTISKLSSSQYGSYTSQSAASSKINATSAASNNNNSNKNPSFDINSYNDYSSSYASSSNHNQSSSTSLLKRPDQYPSYDMDEFWRTFRSWDFIHDLNQSMKKKSKSKKDEEDEENGISTRTVRSTQQQQQQQQKPLPDDFHCHEQYVALWGNLLLTEIKAQIISDVTSVCSPNLPLSKLAQPVDVIVKNMSKRSNGGDSEDNYSEFLTLNISSSNQGRFGNGGGGGGNGRGGNVISRNEFVQNEMVLLITEPSFLDQANKGNLKVNTSGSDGRSAKKSTYCMMTLLSNASPFVSGRLGVVGIVMQRSKNLKSGLVVQISKRFLKGNTPDRFNLCLLRLGYSVTAIREFKALCSVNEMPMMKFLLSAQEKQNQMSSVSSYQEAMRANPLSEHGGRNALGIGFRIWVKSKFNHSQQEAINAASREYGSGGFTLVKGPPGTGKTTTLAALVNALHLRQYQKYYSEIEKITLSMDSNQKSSNDINSLAAIAAAAKVKPRILICAPSNAAIDNIIMKILDDRFMDGNGGKYKPSLVRVGSGCSSSVSNVTLDNKVNQITAIGSKPKELEDSIVALRKDLKRTQIEIGNLQRRIQLVANASTYLLSRDWEIRIDEQNFKSRKRVLFVNHKLKKVELNCPPRPKEGTELYPISEMPHYRSFMASLVKYIERHNENYSKLMQLTLVQNAAVSLETSNYNKVGTDLNRELETHVLNSTHIVMTTLGSAGSRAMEEVAKFSVIVIDEAAQSSEPATLPALKLGSSHCVLVGDPQQLPATIFSMSGRETKFDRSLFQRLEEGGHQVNMLNTQYRMNPKISAFPRQIFYDGSLLDGPNVKKTNYGGELTQMVKSKFRHFKPLTVLDLDSTEEREGTNLSNGDEARLALHLFCSLDHETNGMSKKSKVAIITPYMQQVILIKRLFEGKYGLSYNKMVDISTIDAFQGKEANIVILSCVRGASRSVGIGFLSDVQRMNVALTRAKHFLFVIARCRTILINPFWRDFVAHARKERAILRIIPRRNNQHGGKKYGRRNNGASALIEQMFPDLRHVGPIHQEERGAGIPGINPNQQYNQFQGGISHSQRYNQFQGGGDGNISA